MPCSSDTTSQNFAPIWLPHWPPWTATCDATGSPGQRGTSYFAGGGKRAGQGRRGADPEGRRGGGADGRRGEGARKIGGVTEGMGDYLPRFGSADGAQAHASRLSASRCAATLFGARANQVTTSAPNFGGDGEKTRVKITEREGGRWRKPQELTRLSTDKFRAAHAKPSPHRLGDSTFRFYRPPAPQGYYNAAV